MHGHVVHNWGTDTVLRHLRRKKFGEKTTARQRKKIYVDATSVLPASRAYAICTVEEKQGGMTCYL